MLIKVPEAGVCYIDEAMVAITGMISQNAFFGTTGPSMWLPGSSAFEGAEGFPSDEGLDAGNSHLTLWTGGSPGVDMVDATHEVGGGVGWG